MDTKESTDAAPVATAEPEATGEAKGPKRMPRAERRRAKKAPAQPVPPAPQQEQGPRIDPSRVRIKLEELVETLHHALMIVNGAGKQAESQQLIQRLAARHNEQKALADAGAELEAGLKRLLTEKRKTIPVPHADTLDGLCAAFAKAKAKAEPKPQRQQ